MGDGLKRAFAATVPIGTVRAGQRWRDKDKRELSGNRIVCVLSVEPPFVYYRQGAQGRLLRSRLDRFVKAFRREPTEDAPGVERGRE